MDKQLLQTCMPGLDDIAYERFCLYYARLTETNRVMNLTAITEEQEVASKHFADSLAALPYLNKDAAVIDVGTGAGFPGVPLLIACPTLQLTLADSLQKRLTFLEGLLKELGLSAAIVHGRAEELGQNRLYREKFDFALSRAVANLPVLLELTSPLIKVGGTAIAYKGRAEEELAQARSAAFLLHVKLESIPLVSSIGERALVLAKKMAPTPKIYPRRPGTPAKKPL